MKPYILAHRGDSGSAPENTLASFKKAVDKGADGVELDVHLTADGVPIVIHDETVNRTTQERGRVAEFLLREITKIDAGTYYSSDFSHEKIPSLKEVLEVVSGMKVINIELKNNRENYPGIEQKVIKLTKEMGVFSKIIFSSFNHYSMIKVKEISPDAKIGVLYKAWLFEPWKYGKRMGINNIHPHYRAVNKDIINKCKDHGISVNVYGTNDKDRIEHLIRSGVDMIICDFPAEALEIRRRVSVT